MVYQEWVERELSLWSSSETFLVYKSMTLYFLLQTASFLWMKNISINIAEMWTFKYNT